VNPAGLPGALQAARGRLVEYVRVFVEADRQRLYNPTEEARELRAIAEQITSVVERIESGPAWFVLDTAAVAASYEQTELAATLLRMRELAAISIRAADHLPDSRSRPAAPLAAMLYLHWLYRSGAYCSDVWPTKANNSPGLLDFQAMLEEAGSPLGIERVRQLMSAALDDFDPNQPPPGFFGHVMR
jgi:hypothetical protein